MLAGLALHWHGAGLVGFANELALVQNCGIQGVAQECVGVCGGCRVCGCVLEVRWHCDGCAQVWNRPIQ